MTNATLSEVQPLRVVDMPARKQAKASAYQEVGENIRLYRLSLGLSVTQLAACTGIEEAALEEYENGLGRIDPEHIAIIAEQLNVTIGNLFSH